MNTFSQTRFNAYRFNEDFDPADYVEDEPSVEWEDLTPDTQEWAKEIALEGASLEELIDELEARELPEYVSKLIRAAMARVSK